jgi:hypothetical protein
MYSVSCCSKRNEDLIFSQFQNDFWSSFQKFRPFAEALFEEKQMNVLRSCFRLLILDLQTATPVLKTKNTIILVDGNRRFFWYSSEFHEIFNKH